MVNWEEVTEEKDIIAWDDVLLTASDYSIFQSIAWGEYKRESNWQPVRYWLRDKNGNVQAVVQLLIKKLPIGIKMLWATGGPVFLFPTSNKRKLTENIEGLLETIKQRYPKYVVRFNSYVSNDASLSYNFNKACLRPLFKLSSGYSILMDLDVSAEEVRNRMLKKHRYYVKKSSSSLFSWSTGNSDKHVQDFFSVYNSTMHNKKLLKMAENYEYFMRLRDALRENVLVLNGYLNNIAVTSCILLVFGNKSYYLYAATSHDGRAVSASYAMFEQLAKELKKIKATQFDFGCIAPENSMTAGVDHFKGGFGGQIHQYLGEWESASSTLLRLGVNIAIKLQGSRD